MRDYERELNEEQRRVVFHDNGPMLVIAGAGSGKTRVITYRVARLLENGTSPSSILLLTFTNKAAREMLRRVNELVCIDTGRIWGGTFHHVGNMILRRHAELFGLNNAFSILDEDDARDLIHLILKEQGLTKGRFPRAEVVRDLFSYHTNTVKSSMEEAIIERAPHLLEFEEKIEHLLDVYRERKRKLNVVDFDDLLLFWKRLLEENEHLRLSYAMRFSHILVDEYQDTSKLQADIVDLMGSLGKNVMAVGDDAQSIYSFRGARFENILEFPKRYPEATIFRLTKNYRSTQEILSFANASISHNRRQFPKDLVSVRDGGRVPTVVCLSNTFQEALFVAETIESLKSQGRPLSHMAVLYRAHYQCIDLQMELTRRGIPFEVRSGLRFFEQAHIKDVVSFLKVMLNPADELSLKRCLRLFPGIGKKSADSLAELLRDGNGPISVLQGGAVHKMKNVSKESLALIEKVFSELSEFSRKDAPSSMIYSVVRNLYRDYVLLNFPNPQSRLEDLEELANYAAQYRSLEEFLSDLSLIGGVEGEIIPTEEMERVILTTIHQAKGLEWDVVFLIGCNEGKFPNSKAVEDGNLEEERRLFYVATTRAKSLLFLCYEEYGYDRFEGKVPLFPSRFLKEVPDGTYQHLDLTSL